MSHTSQENGPDILNEDLSSRTIQSCLLPRKDKIRRISWLEIPQDLGLWRRSACHTFSELVIHCRSFLYVGSPLGLELVSVTICFLFDTLTDFPPSTKQKSMAVCWVCFFSLKDTVFLFHSLGKIFKCIWKIFQKMLQIVALWATIQIMSYHWQDINPEMYKISVFFLLTQQFFYITTLNVLESLLPKLWLIFCCHQKKIQKICYFWCFNVYDSGNKHDN